MTRMTLISLTCEDAVQSWSSFEPSFKTWSRQGESQDARLFEAIEESCFQFPHIRTAFSFRGEGSSGNLDSARLVFEMRPMSG